MAVLSRCNVEAFSLRPIPATKEMPQGYRLRMPLGDQYVIAEMFRIQPGHRGAYRVMVTASLPTDEKHRAALEVLADMAGFMVTDWDDISLRLAAGMAAEFHHVWTTGTVVAELDAIRGAFPMMSVDQAGRRWVGVRRGAQSSRL